MKPPSNVKTPAQYIASLPADRAKTIATVRALVNKHIPRGYAASSLQLRANSWKWSYQTTGGSAEKADGFLHTAVKGEPTKRKKVTEILERIDLSFSRCFRVVNDFKKRDFECRP